MINQLPLLRPGLQIPMKSDVLSTGTRHVISQENVTGARTILLPRRRR